MWFQVELRRGVLCLAVVDELIQNRRSPDCWIIGTWAGPQSSVSRVANPLVVDKTCEVPIVGLGLLRHLPALVRWVSPDSPECWVSTEAMEVCRADSVPNRFRFVKVDRDFLAIGVPLVTPPSSCLECEALPTCDIFCFPLAMSRETLAPPPPKAADDEVRYR